MAVRVRYFGKVGNSTGPVESCGMKILIWMAGNFYLASQIFGRVSSKFEFKNLGAGQVVRALVRHSLGNFVLENRRKQIISTAILEKMHLYVKQSV